MLKLHLCQSNQSQVQDEECREHDKFTKANKKEQLPFKMIPGPGPHLLCSLHMEVPVLTLFSMALASWFSSQVLYPDPGPHCFDVILF